MVVRKTESIYGIIGDSGIYHQHGMTNLGFVWMCFKRNYPSNGNLLGNMMISQRMDLGVHSLGTKPNFLADFGMDQNLLCPIFEGMNIKKHQLRKF